MGFLHISGRKCPFLFQTLRDDCLWVCAHLRLLSRFLYSRLYRGYACELNAPKTLKGTFSGLSLREWECVIPKSKTLTSKEQLPCLSYPLSLLGGKESQKHFESGAKGCCIVMLDFIWRLELIMLWGPRGRVQCWQLSRIRRMSHTRAFLDCVVVYFKKRNLRELYLQSEHECFFGDVVVSAYTSTQ